MEKVDVFGANIDSFENDAVTLGQLQMHAKISRLGVLGRVIACWIRLEV